MRSAQFGELKKLKILEDAEAAWRVSLKSFCSAASAFSYLVWVPATPICPAAYRPAWPVRPWPLLWRRLVAGVASAGAPLHLRAEAPYWAARPGPAPGSHALSGLSASYVYRPANKNALHLPQTFRFSIACQVCFFLVGSIFIFNAVLFLTFKLQGGHRVPGPVCACGLRATLSGPRFPHLSNGEINSEV